MNTFGERLRLSTFGESHGAAIGGVLDGLPAGVEIKLSNIQSELDRRKPGGRYATPRKEAEQKCAQIAIELLQNGASHGTSATNGEQTACGDAQSGANCAQNGKKGSQGGSGRARGSTKSEHNNRGGKRSGRDTDKQSDGDQGDAL